MTPILALLGTVGSRIRPKNYAFKDAIIGPNSR
jgi:hypothetical protein